MKRELLLLLVLMTSLTLAGQTRNTSGDEPDDSQIEKYLNDGRGVSRKNLIRFRIGSAAAGYYGLSYERKVVGNLGVEAGLYYRPLSYFFFEDLRLNEDLAGTKLPIDLFTVKGGLGLMVYPKYYFAGKPNRMNSGYFMGLRSTYRTFNSDITVHSPGAGDFIQRDVQASSTAILFTSGSHQRLGSRMVIGIEWGMGFGWDAYKNIDNARWDATTRTVVIEHTQGTSSITRGYIMLDMVFGFLF